MVNSMSETSSSPREGTPATILARKSACIVGPVPSPGGFFNGLLTVRKSGRTLTYKAAFVKNKQFNANWCARSGFHPWIGFEDEDDLVLGPNAFQNEMEACHEPALLRVTDPRSGPRLCEAQRCMVPMHARKRKGTP